MSLGTATAIAIAKGANAPPGPKETSRSAVKDRTTVTSVARVKGHQDVALDGAYVSTRRVRVRGRKTRNAGLASESPAIKTGATAAVANQPLLGYETPAAVPSEDGTGLAYNSWTKTVPYDTSRSWAKQGIYPGDPLGVPRVYVRSENETDDVSLGDGTMSAAFNSDGAIAYAQGTTPAYRLDQSFDRKVLVRSSLDAEPDVWSDSADEWNVLAWVGDRLLVTLGIPDSEASNVMVFDGPGQVRMIAPNASLLAVDADGAIAAVAVQNPGAGTQEIRLVEVASGATMATLPWEKVNDAFRKSPLLFATGPGEWRDDTLVMRTDAGLLTLDTSEGGLLVKQALTVPLPSGILNEPQFVGDGADLVEAWTDVGGSRVRYQCRLSTSSCAASEPVPWAQFGRPAYSLTQTDGEAP